MIDENKTDANESAIQNEFETIGEYFSKARESQGVTLKQVSQKTKINQGLLENLEKNMLD